MKQLALILCIVGLVIVLFFVIIYVSTRPDVNGNCVAPVITIPEDCIIVNVSHPGWNAGGSCPDLFSIVDYQCGAKGEEGKHIEQLKGISLQWRWQKAGRK